MTATAASVHVLQRRVWLTPPDDGLAFAELRGDRFVRDEQLARGVQRCDSSSSLRLVETHPDDLWLLEDFSPWSACPPPARLFRRIRDRWTLQGPIDVHWLALGPWLGKSSLIAEVPLRSGPPWGYSLRTVGGARAPVPRRPPRHVDGGCWTELDWPLALFSNTKGDALVVGVSRCRPTQDGKNDDPSAELAVAERFRAGKAGTLETLPVTLDSDAAVIGRDPDSVWLVGKDAQGRNALVAGRGTGFAIEEVLKADLSLLDADTEGRVWAVENDQLQRREPDGTWTRVPLPPDAGAPLAVDAVSKDDVWLVTESGVYRTLPLERYEATPRECTDEERERLQAPDANASAARGPGKVAAKVPAPHGGCASTPSRPNPVPLDPFGW